MWILNRAFRSDSHVHACLRRWFACITSDVKHCNTEVSHFILHAQTTNKPLVYMSQLGSGNRSLHSREDTPTPSFNPSSGRSHFSFSLSVYFSLSVPIPGGERGMSYPSPARWYCQLISQRYSEVPVGTETTIPRIPWGKLLHRGSMIAQDDTQEINKAESTYTHELVGGLEFVLCSSLTDLLLDQWPFHVSDSKQCTLFKHLICEGVQQPPKGVLVSEQKAWWGLEPIHMIPSHMTELFFSKRKTRGFLLPKQTWWKIK